MNMTRRPKLRQLIGLVTGLVLALVASVALISNCCKVRAARFEREGVTILQVLSSNEEDLFVGVTVTPKSIIVGIGETTKTLKRPLTR